MQNKIIKITIMSIVSAIIAVGIIVIILSSLSLEIKGTTFAGFVLVLSGSIVMLELKRLENFSSELINKFISSIKKEEKVHLYFFLIILTAGIIFRIVYITKLINYNEAFIYLNYLDNKSFQQLFYYTSSNNFILNNIFIKSLFLISNKELWILRIPSLLTGIILIPAVYMAARLFYNKFTAIMAAAVIAASPVFIYYATDMRGISLILLLFLILLLTAGYLRRNDDIIVWIFAAIVSSTGFYAGFVFFIPFIAVAIWLFLSAIFKDTVFNIWHALKRILIFFGCTLMLTFLLYMPVAMSSGLSNIIRYNFKNPGMFKAFNAFIPSIEPYLIIGNKLLNIIIFGIIVIAVILSLIFGTKNKKSKVSVFFALAATVLIFLLAGTTYTFDAILPFILLVLIITGSFGISHLIELIKLPKREANIGKKSKYFSIVFTSLALLGIFFSGFFSNYISVLNSRDTLQDTDTIVKDFSGKFNPKNKILSQKPTDYLMFYSLNKKGIVYSNIPEDYFPENNLIVIVNKSAGEKLDSILEGYYLTDDLKPLGFKGPVVLKDYKSTTVYEFENLASGKNALFDLNTELNLNQIEVKNFNISSTESGNPEFTMIDSDTNSLRYITLPLKLEKNSDYLITFIIQNIEKLDNNIFIDFFGENYDNPQQEFYLDPETIKKQTLLRVRRILNSGELKNTEETFFRIFTNSTGQVIIKDLKIFKITN